MAPCQEMTDFPAPPQEISAASWKTHLSPNGPFPIDNYGLRLNKFRVNSDPREEAENGVSNEPF